MKTNKFALLAATVCTLLVAMPAGLFAEQFDITWSSNDYGSGSAVADTTNEGGGEYLVTLGAGIQNGLHIALLPTDTYGENDNELFPNQSPQLDNNGIAFADETNDYNLYWAPSVSAYYECSSAVSASCIGAAADIAQPLTSFTVTPVSAPAPEPGTIWLLGAGSLVLLRNKRCIRLLFRTLTKG